ncbi:MAG: hypothetical protein NZ929_05070 [Aigarchaeota archaeon]|nr:hypothetical protein [Aigarchaeota archaeon]MCX8192667.1 hypothetical protein [Nitrososphaeria archaeon]MDW7985627.1 hypothetical protein [Nitrososphaerota archaeon]
MTHGRSLSKDDLIIEDKIFLRVFFEEVCVTIDEIVAITSYVYTPSSDHKVMLEERCLKMEKTWSRLEES